MPVICHVEIFADAGADGTAPVNKYLSGENIIGVDWSPPVSSKSLALGKAGSRPQPIGDPPLEPTTLHSAADSAAARPLTKVYLWQFDSSRSSPIATISNPTPAI